jgi:Chromosome segregation ATPases
LLELEQNHKKQQQTLDQFNEQLEQNKEQKQNTQQQISNLRQSIDQNKTELHQIKGQKRSLEALQKAATSEDNDALNQWLDEHKSHISSRLAEVIKVDSGWEVAVETVLRERLQALVADNVDLNELLTGWQFGSITVVQKDNNQTKPRPGRLSEKVEGPSVVIEWLNDVYVCDETQQAENLKAQCQEGESVITQNGDWMGRHWLTLQRGNRQENFLLRKKDIARLEKNIQDNQKKII